MLVGNGKVVCICLDCDSIYMGTEYRRSCISCSSEKTGFWEKDHIFLAYVGMYGVKPEDIKATIIKTEVEKYYMVEDGKYVKRVYEKYVATDDEFRVALMHRNQLVVGPRDTIEAVVAYERTKGRVKSNLKLKTLVEVLEEVEEIPTVEVMTLEQFERL